MLVKKAWHCLFLSLQVFFCFGFIRYHKTTKPKKLLLRRAVAKENSTALPAGTSYLRTERPVLPIRTTRPKRRRNIAPLSKDTSVTTTTFFSIATQVNSSRWTVVGECNQNITSGQLNFHSLIQPIALCITDQHEDTLTAWTARASSIYNCRACPPIVLPTKYISSPTGCALPPELAMLIRLQFFDYADSIEILDSQSASQLMLDTFLRHLLVYTSPSSSSS